MSQVAYVVNDVLGEMCVTLDISGWELIGGHYTFSDYETTLNAVYDAIWAMLDDDTPDNDEEANGYLDTLQGTDYTVMYWSTEKQEWVG